VAHLAYSKDRKRSWVKRVKKSHRPQPERPRVCPNEGKRAYYDRTAAMSDLRAANARDLRGDQGPIHIYKCRSYTGEAHFHIGHGSRGWDGNLDDDFLG
jgi:hypothetical protein